MLEASPQTNYPSRLGVIVVLFLITGPLYVVAGFLGNFVIGKWPVLIGELILPLPAYLYLRLYRYHVRQVFRLNPVSGRIVGLSVVLGMALHVIVYEIDHLLNSVWNVIWPFPEHLESQLEKLLAAQHWLDWVIVLLASVVVAGVFEEMLFRGFVQNTFEQYHDAPIAIAITAAIFAATHGLLWWFVQIFLLGAVLGWMAWRSESIIPGAIVHGMHNLFAVLLTNFKAAPPWLYWQQVKPVLGEGHVQPVFLLAAGVVIYFGLRLFNRFCEEEKVIPTLLNTPL
ncbi:MAG: CPBP family intramembrane metalloprotease [candidate division KSB1 bacterium]|nr:CPBP family intramembrane metalloprotease [candidate division KSB1 bacterium]MDZ7300844.1 CPBP family intramembrane metalloprotease [candidate division KSB1 bacterium]MDZ7309885.1 CPBP family intramembrane metalloprotease [candidate division KSB1 bacterium]